MSGNRERGPAGAGRIMGMTAPALPLDEEAAYRACSARDARWDGRFFLAVTSTGIYCRPSCPARTPARANCRFFPSAAACVAAGFRACKRCRPDALPGTPAEDAGSQLATRAMRRIRDGALDDGGVAGLARSLHVSERQLRRVVLAATGATPQQLASTRRCALARQLIEQTSLPLSDIAFAAGFGSIRRFNEAMRAEFGAAPSAFPRPAHNRTHPPHGQPRPAHDRDGIPAAAAHRGARAGGDHGSPVHDAAGERASAARPRLTLRLRYRPPLHVSGLRAFLANHAVPGLERADDDAHELVVPVSGGHALARISWPDGKAASGQAMLSVRLDVPRLDELMPAITAVRRVLDLDADPGAVDRQLGADPLLAPLVASRPGVRIPGAADPQATALLITLGQQVSVRAARTVQARAVAAYGRALPELGEAWHSGPDPAAIARDGVDGVRERLRIDGNRAAAFTGLARAIADGLELGPGSDRERVRARLLAIERIGPWTADLIAIRCLADPDVFAAGDLVARRGLARLTGQERLSEREAGRLASAWRPWRSYANLHIWTEEYHA